MLGENLPDWLVPGTPVVVYSHHPNAFEVRPTVRETTILRVSRKTFRVALNEEPAFNCDTREANQSKKLVAGGPIKWSRRVALRDSVEGECALAVKQQEHASVTAWRAVEEWNRNPHTRTLPRKRNAVLEAFQAIPDAPDIDTAPALVGQTAQSLASGHD